VHLVGFTVETWYIVQHFNDYNLIIMIICNNHICKRFNFINNIYFVTLARCFCSCCRFLPVGPLLFNTCTVHLLKCITNNRTEIFLNLTIRGPYIVIYFYSKTNQMHNISNLFYFVTTLYMFRTVSPSIIRSLRLYIQHQVYVIQVLWLLASKQPQNLYGMMLYVQS
jgi:hypothetical protein